MSRATAWLVRHGQTEWSRVGRHTSVTDLPLTADGVAAARALRPRLAGLEPATVLTSPRIRARRTAELAGFPGASVDDDLVEWGYGDCEGRTVADIRRSVPGWTIWTHDPPGGETAAEVTARLDWLVERIRGADGDVLLFGHGHSLRALTARWLGLPVAAGAQVRLDTTTLSQVGWERETPVILRWNA